MRRPAVQVTAAHHVRILPAVAAVPAVQWNALAADQPFLRHEFLDALETTGCAAPRTGWQPCHLTLWRGRRLAAAVPLYAKTHSFGEYVFDWAWADAYRRAGLDYYPKLVSAIPFTPVTGARLLAVDDSARTAVIAALLDYAGRSAVSSMHVLFPTGEELAALQAAGLQLRFGVQFHWNNDGYRDFDDFLETLQRDKRKKIRQERRRVADAGVAFRILVGAEIRRDEWAFFQRCYERTYRRHRSSPYLNRAFFERIGATLGEHLMLLIAERHGRPIAAALNVFTPQTLWGRYWGAVEDVPLLHFEACYYRAIDFCIARGIGVFEGGAQGEHKLARGFLPVRTGSAHWLRDSRFAGAVARYLERETGGIEVYLDELTEHSPFRSAPG